MRLILIYGLLMFLIHQVYGCISLKCNGPASINPSGEYVCHNSSSTPDTLNIYTCPATEAPYICDATLDTSNTCKKLPLFPGSKTPSPQRCSSAQATNGYCRGLLLGESCSQNHECDVGLSCINGDCSSTSSPGSISCTELYDCPAMHGCHNSYCTMYGSLPVGTKLSKFTGFWDAYLCTTFWADPNTLKCASEGFTTKTKQMVDQSKGEYCDITYKGNNVGEEWYEGTNPFLKWLASGICCFRGDGMAVCPISTSQQANYIIEILDFISDNLDIAVSSKFDEKFTGTRDTAFTSFGLAPIQEHISGFDGALIAFCKLFWTPCADAVECMQTQTWFSPVNLFPMCFQNGAFTGYNLYIWVGVISALFLVAAITIALILIYKQKSNKRENSRIFL